MFWIIFDYFLTFVTAVVIIGGSVLVWIILFAILKGWIPYDDGKRSNFD